MVCTVETSVSRHIHKKAYVLEEKIFHANFLSTFVTYEELFEKMWINLKDILLIILFAFRTIIPWILLKYIWER